MRLIDEAKGATIPTGYQGAIDKLCEKLPPAEWAEVVELLHDPSIGASAAARVLDRHYREQAGRQITRQMVDRWRARNL